MLLAGSIRLFSSAAGRSLSTAATGEFTVTEVTGRVGLVRLNRPPLNPLNDALYDELASKLEELDRDPAIGCLVLTGNERAFAAGADIKHMAGMNFPTCFGARLLGSHKRIDLLKTPLVGVVRGFALGGGCELAMQCDILFAGESAKFGQPEVKLGTIPGAGGTQRLIRAVGKSRAMQMILAGEPISARQAADWGLVSEVHPDDKVLEAALKVAEQIAGLSKPVISLAKVAVNTSYEVGLKAGLDFEERVFQSTFALDDKMEGMGAFVSKRQPTWTHK